MIAALPEEHFGKLEDVFLPFCHRCFLQDSVR